jgi:hypothetical protein
MEKLMNYRILCLSLLLLLALTSPASASDDAQESIMAEITRLGGQFERDENLPGKPIIKVDLHSTKVTDSDLKLLKKLPELRTLDLRLTGISDAGIANIKKLTKLQTLNLFRTQLTEPRPRAPQKVNAA